MGEISISLSNFIYKIFQGQVVLEFRISNEYKRESVIELLKKTSEKDFKKLLEILEIFPDILPYDIIRLVIMRRDNFKCQSELTNHSENLHIHHVNGHKDGDRPSNLLTLCARHHIGSDYKDDLKKYRRI